MAIEVPRLFTSCFLCGRELDAGEPFRPALAYGQDGKLVNVGSHVTCDVELVAQRTAFAMGREVDLDLEDEDDEMEEAVAAAIAKHIRKIVRDHLKGD